MIQRALKSELITEKLVKLVQFCNTLLEKQEVHIRDHKSWKKCDVLLDNCLLKRGSAYDFHSKFPGKLIKIKIKIIGQEQDSI